MRDKENIKAQLEKQIKDAVSEIDAPEDPAIISQQLRTSTTSAQQNPESAMPQQEPLYKKKVVETLATVSSKKPK